jgi:arylsulfatase A-like enzyme
MTPTEPGSPLPTPSRASLRAPLRGALRLALPAICLSLPLESNLAATESPAVKPPNILFILCDDLGINDLHCYGRAEHNTPHLDRLAEQGMRFTSAYASQAICSPSRAGLLTGLNPARLHVTDWIPGRPNAVSQRVLQAEMTMRVPLTICMMPRYFREAGYATGLFGKWHLGKTPGPAEHGFEVVHNPADDKNTTPDETEGGKAEYELTNEVIRFMRANRERPFFAFLSHYTPHTPYAARESLVKKNSGAFEPVYAALIETLDDSVGLLLSELKALGLEENTIMVFTSDNGGLHVPESSHERITHNTPFRAGKGFTYEGGQRVPLIVRWPGHIPADRVVDAPVNNVDWLPTFLELASLKIPDGLDGVSFAKGLAGGAFPERPLFWHYPHYSNQGGRPSGAMRDGEWMLIEFYDDGHLELYNLAADPGQKNNLAAKEPERAAAMKAALAGWRTANHAQSNAPNPDFNEAEFRRVYVDADAGTFDPLTADDAAWAKIRNWRKDMNRLAPWKPDK